jgi:predicted site-specific integrase-resolvase
MDIARDSNLGEANYRRISVGDLVSWKDITENDPEQFGIVLSKYISRLHNRNICMLKVASTKDNMVKNILAIIVKIESKMTT